LQKIFGADFGYDELYKADYDQDQPQVVRGKIQVFEFASPLPEHKRRNGRNQVAMGKVFIDIPIMHRGPDERKIKCKQSGCQNADLKI